MADMKRLGVFVDYQNAFNRAKECFCGAYPDPQDGQFHPSSLAHEIAGMAPGRVLEKVAVYRGQPNPRRDAKGAGAAQRQMEAWKKAGVEVKTRPLGGYQYGAPREKGIDVLIALDLVVSALAGEYDVIALASADSDLVPALEWAHRFSNRRVAIGQHGVDLETVVWMPASGGAQRLKVGKVPVTERAITEPVYDKIHDPRDYTRG